MGKEMFEPILPKSNNIVLDPYELEIPAVNANYKTNIQDGAEINKKVLVDSQKISEDNISSNGLVIKKPLRPDSILKTAVRTTLNVPMQYAKGIIVGGFGTAMELGLGLSDEYKTVKEKGIIEVGKETISSVKDYYKQQGGREIVENVIETTYGQNQDILKRIMPKMAEIRDDRYIHISKDTVIDRENIRTGISIEEDEYSEMRKIRAEKAVEVMKITNNLLDSIINKTGLQKQEKDGLLYDLLSLPTQAFSSVILMAMLKNVRLVTGMYGLMQKADTTLSQVELGDTAENALSIGNKVGIANMLAEGVNLSLFKKWFFAPTVKNSLKETFEESVKTFYRTTGKALWGKSILNESITGAVQETANIYLPEKLGKGNNQTFLENMSQIAIAGAMEGIGGGIASAPFSIFHAIRRSSVKMGMSENEADTLAENLTPVVEQESQNIQQNILNEVMNITPEEETKIAQQLTKGLEQVKQQKEGAVEQEEIPTVIKGALFAKTQNQEQSDKMAEVLQSTIELHEEVSGVDRENLTDKELVSIQTSDFEQLNYLSNILNTEQTQEQIVNNASNLFLQTVLKARETEVGKRAEITNEIDLFIGKPTDNQYNQEQKAKLQEAFYNYLITGKAKSNNQKNLFDFMKSQLNKTYFALSEKNMLDEKTEVAYSSLIKELNPKLTKRELTEQLANDLKEEIVKLRQGKPTNLERVKVIKELLDFGKSFYNKNASEEDIQLFQNYAEFYRKVFNDLGNLQGVKNIVNQLEEKGLFTFDEVKYNSLLNTLVKAEKKIKEVIRSDKKDLRDKFNAGLGVLNTMLNRLEDIDIKSKNLNDFVLSINPNANTTEELLSGIQQIENAFSETKNLLSQKYVSSEYYKILKKNYEKPEINFANIKIKVQTALSKFIADINSQTLQKNINENSLMTVNKILKELKGFEPEIENKIKNILLKAKTIDDVYYGIDKILFEVEQYVNKEYVKRVNKKIKNQIADLTEKAKEGDLQIEDNIFVNNLFNFGKNFNKKIDDKINAELEKKDSLYTMTKEDIADLEKKIEEGNLSVEEKKETEDNLFSQKQSLMTIEKELIDELIYTDTKVEQFTKNEGKPFQVSDRQQTLAQAYLEYIYTNKVNNKEAVDSFYQLYKTLDKFSNEVLAEENARKELEYKEIIETSNKITEHLKKTKTFIGFNKFLKGMADISNFLESVLGVDAFSKFDTTIAETKARIMTAKARKKLHNFVKDVTGMDFFEYTTSLMRSKIFTESKNEKLKKLNTQTALYYYILSKNKKGLVSVLNTVGREGLNEIESKLSIEDKQVASALSSILESMYPEINEAYMAIHNKPMGKEEVYFMIIHAFDSKLDTVDSIMESTSMLSSKLDKEPNWTLSRKKSDRLLADKVNPFIVFDKYIEDAGIFSHVTPILNKLSILLETDNIKNDLRKPIEEKFGDKSFLVLEKLIENINGTAKNNNINWMLAGSKTMDFFARNLITSKVFGKIFTSVKQLASISLYASVMPTKDYIKYTSYAFKNVFQVRQEMMEFSENLKVRYESMTMNDKIVDKVIAIDERFATLQKTKEISTRFTRYCDSITVTVGSYAYMKHLQSLGKYTEQEIVDKLNYMAEKSQQSALRSSQGLYQFQTKDAVIKTLMAYRSAQMQYFRQAMMTIYRMQNGTITRQEGLKTLAVYLLVNPLIFGIMSLPMTARAFILDPSDDDNKEEIYKLFVRPIANQILSVHYATEILGQSALDYIAKELGQKTYRPSSTESILFSDLLDSLNAMRKTLHGNIDDDEGYNTFIKIMQGLQLFTSVPIKPILRMTKGGTYDMLEGNFIEGFMNILNVPQSEIDKLLDN